MRLAFDRAEFFWDAFVVIDLRVFPNRIIAIVLQLLPTVPPMPSRIYCSRGIEVPGVLIVFRHSLDGYGIRGKIETSTIAQLRIMKRIDSSDNWGAIIPRNVRVPNVPDKVHVLPGVAQVNIDHGRTPFPVIRTSGLEY